MSHENAMNMPLRACLKIHTQRRVRGRGLQETTRNPAFCRPGPLTGRIFRQALTRNRAFRRSIHRASFFVTLLLTALGMARASAQFSSGLIDFNYNFSNYGYPGYSTGPGAIGSAGDLWNL